MDNESTRPGHNMGGVESARPQPHASTIPMPSSHDQHETSYLHLPVIDTIDASTLIADPSHTIGDGLPHGNDCNTEHSAEELTMATKPVGDTGSAHCLPTTVETPSTHLMHLDLATAAQPLTAFPQLPEQDPEDGFEVQDEAQYDIDSAYDGDSRCDDDTGTLASFITNYRWENGRRYHAYSDGAYWGPNDEDANDGQDLAHHLYKLTLDHKLHLAPMDNPHKILDLGTGTGIWATQMADLYSCAHVIGTDLSPIQPTFVPPNCHFEIEDVNLDWTYPANHFDFIHVRELFGSVPDWDRFFQQSLLALKPSGYLEILEHSVQPVSDDDTVSPESFFTLWGNTVIEMGEKRGKSFSIWKESKERMQRAGFEGLVEHRFKWPMNGWSKDPKLRELGQWNQLRLYDGIEGMMIRMLTNAGGLSYQRAQVFLAEMRRALKDYTVHAYLEVSVVYGRKPPTNPAAYS